MGWGAREGDGYDVQYRMLLPGCSQFLFRMYGDDSSFIAVTALEESTRADALASFREEGRRERSERTGRRQGRNRNGNEKRRVKVPLLAAEAREAAGSSNTANPTVGGRYCDDSALRKALLVRSAEHTHSRWEPMRMAQSAGGDANGVGEVGTAVTERTNVH